MAQKFFNLFPHADYAQKFSFAIVYALLAAISINFFINQDIYTPVELPG